MENTYFEAVYLQIIFLIDYQCKAPESTSAEVVEFFRILLFAGTHYVKMKANILSDAKKSPGSDILAQSISVIETNLKRFITKIEKCIPKLKAKK